MKALSLLAACVVAFAGCLAPTDAAVEDASVPVAEAATTTPTPDVLEWSGHVMTSTGEFLTHQRPSEDVLWPVEQEGILAEIPEGVTDLEVALHWDGPGEFMIDRKSVV